MSRGVGACLSVCVLGVGGNKRRIQRQWQTEKVTRFLGSTWPRKPWHKHTQVHTYSPGTWQPLCVGVCVWSPTSWSPRSSHHRDGPPPQLSSLQPVSYSVTVLELLSLLWCQTHCAPIRHFPPQFSLLWSLWDHFLLLKFTSTYWGTSMNLCMRKHRCTVYLALSSKMAALSSLTFSPNVFDCNMICRWTSWKIVGLVCFHFSYPYMYLLQLGCLEASRSSCLLKAIGTSRIRSGWQIQRLIINKPQCVGF